MIVKREGGFHVLSEGGKNLGGPYKTHGEAAKRLRQVEYFKHHKTASLKKLGFMKKALSPELLRRASNKSGVLSKELTSNVSTLNSIKNIPVEHADEYNKIVNTAIQKARRKSSQSTSFLTESFKRE